MSAIVLVDTSILLNVVNVPGRNQQRVDILGALAMKIDEGDHLFGLKKSNAMRAFTSQ